jgi:long-chain acyl-CoA synthetase
LHRQVEEHFREVSASLPYFKRVKVLHFTDVELPRTATRKVKRREVVQIMESLEESQKSGRRGSAQETANADSMWLLGVVATVANRPRAEVSIDTRLSDLGFDSLMFVELATAIEGAGASISAPERFNEVQDVKELLAVVNRQPSTSAKGETRPDEQRKDDEIHVPSFVRTAGNKAADFLQGFLYDQFLRTNYEGRSNIPPHTNFIVAANHCSHLDMGLTKMALGEYGKELVALAAADYFFDTKYKRAVMENFTNLVPMERTGSLRQSLRHAKSFLDRGYNALIFPEGTRSMTGIMADYKPVVGYLALHARVGILPIFLDGTYEAMPKGTTIIKNRDVGARIGRFLEIEELEEMTKGMPRAEAYRLIAARVRHEVVNLRDRTRTPFDAKGLRKQWKNERKKDLAPATEEVMV